MGDSEFSMGTPRDYQENRNEIPGTLIPTTFYIKWFEDNEIIFVDLVSSVIYSTSQKR